MIPKTIHYIWLGGNPKSRLNMSCRTSWGRVLPDFQIKEWNERNLPLKQLAAENKFFATCLKLKAWAFVSDYLRLYVLYNHGGVYFDTDVEVVRSITPLLKNTMFVGLENNDFIGTSVIGAERHNSVIKRLLNFYDEEIWQVDFVNNPIIFRYLMQKEPDTFSHCKVLGRQAFSPVDPSDFARTSSAIRIPMDTYSIHWYSGNWNETLFSYVFLSTKHISNPILRWTIMLKKTIGYLGRRVVIKRK